MLRALLAVLLLANLVFFGWARGWFAPAWPAPRAGEREPARLAAQVAPERVTVLAPAAASAAVAALGTLPCLEIGPLDETQAGAIEAQLLAAGLAAGTWQRAALPGSTGAASATAPAAASAPGIWLRVAAADTDQVAVLAALPAASLAGGFKACAARP